MDILAYLIEKNQFSSEPAHVLRDRFIQSCAAYCVITFLLGVCDRHLDNIMLRSDGCLFHIDYGYVLGQDPKPLSTPKMRISQEMLAVLGGTESETFKNFKQLCSKIYNCLRRHVNLFVCMLKLLVDAYPPIVENGPISEARLMKEICNRFVPGESFEEAEIFLYTNLSQSTAQTFSTHILDKFHSLGKISYSDYLPNPWSLTKHIWGGEQKKQAKE